MRSRRRRLRGGGALWAAERDPPRQRLSSGEARHFRHHPDDGDRDGSGFPRVWRPDPSRDRAFTCRTRCGDATLRSRLQKASVQVTTVLADVTAFVLLLAITAYSVAGGVDYGAGIWDMLAGRGPTAEKARQLIDHAMAPVWEANNVWLVLAIVVCWTGFPLLFQSVFGSLYPLFAVALLALILRGAFFAFRHVQSGPQAQSRMGIVFGISSVLAPFFFAAALGAIASGRVAVGGPDIPVWQACFNPTSISFGLVSLAATAFRSEERRVGKE